MLALSLYLFSSVPVLLCLYLSHMNILFHNFNLLLKTVNQKLIILRLPHQLIELSFLFDNLLPKYIIIMFQLFGKLFNIIVLLTIFLCFLFVIFHQLNIIRKMPSQLCCFLTSFLSPNSLIIANFHNLQYFLA